MMSTVGVRVELGARNHRGAGLAGHMGPDRRRVALEVRKPKWAKYVAFQREFHMADNARRTGPALEAHQQFLFWLVPTVEKFPRAQKFVLGDRIQATALDVLEALIEATYTRDRRQHLARANLGLEKLRHFFRIAVELKHLDPRRYEHAARTLDEIGRLVGAWAKAHATHSGAGVAHGQEAH